MRTNAPLSFILCAAALFGLTGSQTHAHLGDRVFPIWEVPSSEIPDLHDGSLADWDAALPDRSLDTYDFSQQLLNGEIDLESLAFRVLLAWNNSAQQLYLALERVDDELARTSPYDYAVVMVDGDHSGQPFVFSEAGQEHLTQSQAQSYAIYMDPAELPQVAVPVAEDRVWAAQPEWSDIGSYELGTRPNVSFFEMSLTLWDTLSPAGAERSVRSSLWPGKIIGLQVFLSDVDDGASPPLQGLYSIGGHFGGFGDASFLADAQLIPCFYADCSSPANTGPVSVVRTDAWGRIKVGLQPAD